METAAEIRTPSERIAHGVSYVVNPLVLPPLLVGAVLLEFGAPFPEIGLATSVALLLMTALPLAFLWWMVKSGRASALDVVEQGERTMLFVFAIACTLAAFAALFAVVETARAFILSIGLCVVLAGALLAMLNLRWKVSIHATAISGFVAVLITASALAEPPTSRFVLLLLPLVPLVMWARVRTRSHSVGQVVAGTGVGAAVPLLTLLGLAAAGVF